MLLKRQILLQDNSSRAHYYEDHFSFNFIIPHFFMSGAKNKEDEQVEIENGNAELPNTQLVCSGGTLDEFVPGVTLQKLSHFFVC